LAHKGSRTCDSWWENETEWHRLWKNNFSTEWQECILFDQQTGEKHIADIRTDQGLVIEFQHSHINPNERVQRENFYKNMIWIVDGTRLKRDYPRFLKGKEYFRRSNMQGHFYVDYPEDCFPNSWVGSSVPVIFDFKGLETISDPRDFRNYLYYLHPKSNAKESVVAIAHREPFINNIISGDLFNPKGNSLKQQTEPIKRISTVPQKQSEYVLNRGQFVKRRRF